MPLFDINKALDIINNGTQHEKELLIEDIATRLEYNNTFGLVFEQGSNNPESPFEQEAVVDFLNKNVPFPYRNDNLSFPSTDTNLSEKRRNLLLEGDNYLWLQILLNVYYNSIDVIYIDPPYNTGKKDFKYNDKFVDENDEWRHSKWLDFMNKRLILAKQLLKSTGVIFISIDEHEFAQLKLLCDEIFGEENYIENFIWVKNVTKNMSLTTSTNHEYILCYAKNKKTLSNMGVFRINKEGYNETLAFVAEQKELGKTPKEAEIELKKFYKSHKNWKGITSYQYIDDDWKIYTSNDMSAPNATGKGATYDVIHPITGKPCTVPSRGWAKTEENMKQLIRENRVLFGEDEKKIPRFKRLLTDMETEVMKSIIVDNTDGKKQLQKIFDEAPFNNAKPTTLIRYLLSGFPSDSVILDFFAGSGTTAQAVMELNMEDDGNRTWILCTNNEGGEDDVNQGICRAITKPRIDTIISGRHIDGTTYCTDIDNETYDYYEIDSFERKATKNANIREFDLTDAPEQYLMLKYRVVPVRTLYDYVILYEGYNQHIIVFWQTITNQTIEQINEIINEYPDAVLFFAGNNYVLLTDEIKEILHKKHITYCSINDIINSSRKTYYFAKA